MIYIEYLDQTFYDISDMLYTTIHNTIEHEYALTEVEELISTAFPDINIDNLDLFYNCWKEYDGPNCIGWDYEFTYDDTEFKQKYPEYYI